jgi:hypothetical protein
MEMVMHGVSQNTCVAGETGRGWCLPAGRTWSGDRSRREGRGRVARLICVAAGAVVLAGCCGDARVELSAADSIETLSAALEGALEEYHADLAGTDDQREAAVIAAFVRRIRDSAGDPAAQEGHVSAFTAALGHVRADRRVAWSRYAATRDNIDTLREITRGLRRLAVESLTLGDEARRYVHALIERRSAAASGRSAPARVPIE